MRVAFFSPMPPAVSGIGDYSAALAASLSRFAHLDYFANDGRPFDPAMGFGNTVATDVSNLGVTGEHWISSSWAINYNAGVNYNVLTPESNVSGLKPEFRFGLRLRF